MWFLGRLASVWSFPVYQNQIVCPSVEARELDLEIIFQLLVTTGVGRKAAAGRIRGVPAH